jgi:hypothetical protein
MSLKTYEVKIDGKIGLGFQNRVKFEYVFLRKYMMPVQCTGIMYSTCY